MEKKGKINKYVLLCYLVTFACGFGSAATSFVKLDMRLYLGLSNTIFATLGTVNLVVSIVMNLGLGRILDRIDNKKLIVTGLSLQVTGLVVGVFISNPVMVVISTVFSSIGYSLSSSAAYPAFMMIDPDNVTLHVNREQGALTLGAFLSPLIMAVIINVLNISWRIAYIIYAVSEMLLLLFCLTLKSPGIPEKHFETEEEKEESQAGKKKIFSLYFVLTALALTFYMVMEAGIINYSKDFFTLDLDFLLGASLCISAIRGGMTISRMYGEKVVKDRRKLSIYSMVLTIVSIICLALFKNNILCLISIFLFGFFSGACWPTIFSFGLLTDKSISGKLTSILLICNTIGNNAGNILSGAVIDNFNIRTAFIVAAAMGAVCLASLVFAVREGKKKGISASEEQA